jgi:hypothetical protein
VATRLASGANVAGTIEYRLDAPTGPVLARVPVSGTGGWQNWTTQTVPTERQVTGVRRLYVRFAGPTGVDLVNLNWFRFE